ncbi:MAG TPA: DUF6152 family protein [Gammaproteobacteria bacterium]|nr:DUF6152 family protein [Gammaproteobacteria bacterium]
MEVNAMRAGILGLLVCAPCFAHHGVAPHYDTTKPVKLEGVVARFEFINPHSFVYVDVVDAAGAKQTWTCELASRTVLSRNGLSAASFKPGERITIEGVAARHNPTGCAFRVAHFADGSELQSTALFGPTAASAAEIPADPLSIVGVWTMKRFAVSDYSGMLTEAGERARAAFDPVKDDPAIYCDPASPVRFWVNVNEPFEIERDGDSVVIEHRFMDARRVVHLTKAAPADAPRGTMGWSIGRFDGAALVVSTDHFVAATLEPRYGVLHTQDLKLTERLAVNAAGELEITWVIDDPAYFKTPVTQTEVFVRSRRDPEPYDCKPGYRQ